MEDTGLNKVKWILRLEPKTSGTLSLASVSIYVYMYIGVYKVMSMSAWAICIIVCIMHLPRVYRGQR